MPRRPRRCPDSIGVATTKHRTHDPCDHALTAKRRYGPRDLTAVATHWWHHAISLYCSKVMLATPDKHRSSGPRNHESAAKRHIDILTPRYDRKQMAEPYHTADIDEHIRSRHTHLTLRSHAIGLRKGQLSRSHHSYTALEHHWTPRTVIHPADNLHCSQSSCPNTVMPRTDSRVDLWKT